MTKPMTLYIIDDSQIERSMLTDHLAKHSNLTVKEFSNGEYFLRELIMGNIVEPDVVLLDYFLDTATGGGKDGLEILSKLKQIYPNVKVIMLTSVENERIKELAINQGALDYVVKGVNAHQHLDAVLEKHLIVKKLEQA
jgi:DNA-binding NtrC family response regulator